MLRLAFLAVPFTLFYMIGWPWWLALVVAALISLSLSVIFLSKQRDIASTSIHEWRMRDRTHDDIVEDEAVEAVDAVDAVDDAPAQLGGTDGGGDRGERPKHSGEKASSE